MLGASILLCIQKMVRLVAGNKHWDGSDDELHEANALLGAPVDSMKHHKKLQGKHQEKISNLAEHENAPT